MNMLTMASKTIKITGNNYILVKSDSKNYHKNYEEFEEELISDGYEDNKIDINNQKQSEIFQEEYLEDEDKKASGVNNDDEEEYI